GGEAPVVVNRPYVAVIVLGDEHGEALDVADAVNHGDVRCNGHQRRRRTVVNVHEAAAASLRQGGGGGRLEGATLLQIRIPPGNVTGDFEELTTDQDGDA